MPVPPLQSSVARHSELSPVKGQKAIAFIPQHLHIGTDLGMLVLLTLQVMGTVVSNLQASRR